VLPSPHIDPKNKAMIDAYLEVRDRDRSRRAWQFWLFVAAVSVGALWLVRYEWIPQYVRLSLAVLGGLGLLLVLVFPPPSLSAAATMQAPPGGPCCEGGVTPNSASVTDACGRRSRAFFGAAQRGR
jgi:hypothetical protein